MAISDLQKILKQVHEFNEFTLVPHNMTHGLYWIWKLENAKMKDLNLYLRPFRKEHARFDIFINGQFVIESDYLMEQVNNDFHVKFIKANFDYIVEDTDEVKIEGDIERI